MDATTKTPLLIDNGLDEDRNMRIMLLNSTSDSGSHHMSWYDPSIQQGLINYEYMIFPSNMTEYVLR
jgi:hypothetical protein